MTNTHPHLEGLIAEVNAVATLADEARVAYAGHHASGTFRRIAERLDAVRAALAALPGGGVDVEKALRQAFALGQTYWSQADSESFSQNRKADGTLDKFRQLIRDTLPTPPPHEADRNG